MKYKFFTAIAVSAMAISSCSTDTDTLGSSLTNESDKLVASTQTYNAYSHSVLIDSIYARNYDTYFGRVRDPETGAYVKTEFMAQFNIQEGLTLPAIDKMVKDDQNKVVAQSCEIWLAFDESSCYGDSLAALKMNVLELNKPMSETATYYTNYDPRKGGFIREDGLKKSVLFTKSNLTFSDSIRKNVSNYFDYVRVALSDEYTDKAGNTYDNYGTYILRNFYEHPEYFKNSYAFTNNICPGFFFELADGLGLMAKFSIMELRVFYQYQSDSSTTSDGYLAFSSTPEVLQTTQVTNDTKSLARLAEDQSCTYLKAPAGIYTEVTLPVDEISQTHASDSLLSVSITFQRQNSEVEGSYLMSAPSTIVMMPTDSLGTFFEQEKSYDYKSAFMASLSSTNSYTFSNIGNLITLLINNKKNGLASDPDWVNKHPNWNKVLLMPVSVSTSNNTTGNNVVVILNDMGLHSTKLVGGVGKDIKVNVIYARYNTR